MPSLKTFLTVKNNTNYPIKTNVRCVRSYDWDGKSRPDLNFQNLTIMPKGKVVKREEINTWATANMYTLDITCNNMEKISCRIDQGVAANRCKAFEEYLPIKVVTDVGALVGTFAPVAGTVVMGAAGVAASGCAFADKCYTRVQHYERRLLKVTRSQHYDALLTVTGNNITVDIREDKIVHL